MPCETVDGPRVTVNYYGPKDSYPIAFSSTPTLNFVKLNSFGYSLDGKEFLIAEGQTYANIEDSGKNFSL